MKRLFVLVSMFLGLAVSAGAQTLETLLGRLDQVVEDKEDYNRKKEGRINGIRSSVAGIKPGNRYGIYDALYREYAKYNLDSALFYAKEKAQIAGTREEHELSLMELADIYTNSGEYALAEDCLKNVSTRNATYFHALHTLYAAMEATSVVVERRVVYASLKRQYRDSLLSQLPSSDVGYIFAMSEKMNETGSSDKAIALLADHYNDPFISENDKAILDYCLATSYRGLGNREKAKWYYASSAMADLRTPVKEYRSLQELAYMLYQDGDLSRANRYINCAMEDVRSSNTIVRSVEFFPILSTIGKDYERDIERRNRIQRTMMTVLLALLVLLGVAAAITMRQRRQISRTNLSLKETNRKLEETGLLKDEYLYQYMEQAAAGMDRMESYRRKIILAYRKYGADKLASQLESPLDTEKEMKDFYNSFDQTFLHIFPTFVEDVNSLLKPQQKLEPKPGRLMNTELRILALIRLGVTDNVKMSHFLRTSLSTIYNYRSRLRNAALGDLADFEQQVAKIGTIKPDNHE